MPSGEQLRVLVAPSSSIGVLDRGGAPVLERSGDHAPALAAASTARTMLW